MRAGWWAAISRVSSSLRRGKLVWSTTVRVTAFALASLTSARLGSLTPATARSGRWMSAPRYRFLVITVSGASGLIGFASAEVTAAGTRSAPSAVKALVASAAMDRWSGLIHAFLGYRCGDPSPHSTGAQGQHRPLSTA